MGMEPRVAVECEGLFQAESLLVKDGESGIISSLPCIVASQQPVKKQTRQWAAWTRQEEESFFNALRQVGKNFEKITCRVQSKNKDQVRHYYYRLVRRMNKLLGPGFSLDAKNSKDTNAAMLRWWSLLEKYSCKASKLHLKPRRFKIFIEALEHQLLKDRKKTTRKRPSQGEGSPTASSVAVSLNNRASGHDTRPVKLVIVDSQMIQKVGPGKGSSLKRNTGTNRNKSDLSTVKTLKQRRKTGGASSAAYKRWEKAAIAGVSLVADAAEQLERATTNFKRFSPDQGALDETFPRTVAPTGQNVSDSLGVLPPLPLSASSQPQVAEASEQQAFTKLKLQLFPIDESTRTALEKDEHNPYLELTLSARKKISSVLEHLNRKWGNSSIASGTLMLFPYSAEKENLVGYPRWMQDTVASAADVYTIVGSPTTFRLRYGWFSSADLMSVAFRRPTPLYVREEHTTKNIFNGKEQILDPMLLPNHHDCNNCDQLADAAKDQLTSRTENTNLIPHFTDLPEDITGYIGMDHEKSLPKPEHAINSSWLRKEIGDETIRRHCADAVFPSPIISSLDNPRTSNDATLSAGDWADSLTNISIGELLSGASQSMGTNNIEPSAVASSQFLQQIPFSCDSFDAAIAAHISGCLDKQNLLSAQVSHAPSILDAEETCDAFSFRKISSSPADTYFETRKQVTDTCSMVARASVKELPEVYIAKDRICSGDLTDHCDSDTERLNDSDAQRPDEFTQDLGGLTDMYWPDSLGPLDLDMPSSRYHDQDLMFGDNSISLSGLNRLIASSLDAFQNCSFFGLEKKEAPLTTSEARGTAPLLDYKIGGEV